MASHFDERDAVLALLLRRLHRRARRSQHVSKVTTVAAARTSAQAIFIAVFFIMPSFVLSGSMLPYELMPHGVREFGGLFPLRWFQIAARRIIVRGASLGEVAVPILVLLAIFATLLTAIRRLLKPRLG